MLRVQFVYETRTVYHLMQDKHIMKNRKYQQRKNHLIYKTTTEFKRNETVIYFSNLITYMFISSKFSML